MTSIRATTNVETGETKTRELAGAPVHSSQDFQSPGVQVIRGFGGETVASPDALQDDDLVTIDGVQMSVRSAKQFGVLDQAFNPTRTPDQLDPKLSAAAADKAAAEAVTNEASEEADWDNADDVEIEYPENFEQTSAALDDAVEAGELSSKEANEYATSFGALEMAGIALDDAVEVLQGIEDGSIGELEVDASALQTIRHAEGQVRQAATEAARSEMDAATFAWLESAAQSTPAVREAIQMYAMHRAQGLHDGNSWADFAAHVRGEMANL